MKSKVLFAGVIVAAVAAPLAAQAQGVPGGFAHGASEGWRIAGPVGAVVGAPVGGVIGGIEGLLGVSPSYQEPPPPRATRQRVAAARRRAAPRRAHVTDSKHSVDAPPARTLETTNAQDGIKPRPACFFMFDVRRLRHWHTSQLG